MRKGHDDSRAKVFWQTLQLTVWMFRYCNLKLCMVENVHGLVSKCYQGGRSFWDYVQCEVDKLVPGLNWVIQRHQDTLHTALPQTRRRVYIVGYRTEIIPAQVVERIGKTVSDLVRALPASSPGRIGDFLDWALPATPLTDMCENIRNNYYEYEAHVRRVLSNWAVADGAVPEVVLAQIDRRIAGMRWNNTPLLFDRIGCLRTHDQYWFVFCAQDHYKLMN